MGKVLLKLAGGTDVCSLWVSMMMGGYLIVSVVSDPRAGLCRVATKIQASISTASAVFSDIWSPGNLRNQTISLMNVDEKS